VRDFIFNRSTYGKVWHVVENVKIETFPAEVIEEPGSGVPPLPWQRVKPACMTFKGKAICNQVGTLTAGGLDRGHWTRFNKPGMQLVYKAAKRLYRHTDTDIPEPLCTACARKAGLL
jgi:hypothetical protein